MRIAFFYNLPGGGSVTVLKNWYLHLTKKHHVDLYSISEPNPNKWEKLIFKKKTHTMPVQPWKGFLFHNLWILVKLRLLHKKLAQTIDRKNYDLVIVHHDIYTKSPFLLRYLKTKKLYVLHEPPREFYEHYTLHASSFKKYCANMFRYYLKFIDATNVRSADLIVSNSMYSRKVIKKVYGIDSVVIYPWLGREFTRNRRNKLQRKDQVICVGSLSKIKGHDFVIDSLKPLFDHYKLIIIGDGTNRDIARISSNDLTNLQIITNHVSTESLIKYFDQSRLLCIGSHFEPFGLTSIEAQARGLPVLCVNEGGIPETINQGISGISCKRDKKIFYRGARKILFEFNRYSSHAKNNSQKWSEKTLSVKLDNLIASIK